MLSNDKLNRRQILIGAAAGAVGIGAAALSPITALAAERSVVGTWDVQITDTSGPEPATFEGATTFAPGGGVVTMDSNSPSTGVGSWAKKGERGAFVGRFMQFGFSPEGTSKVLVSIKGNLSEHDTISGTFTFKVYDLKGQLLFDGGKGMFTGTRFSAG